MSGRPSPLTSATATPAYHDAASAPVVSGTVVNVPSSGGNADLPELLAALVEEEQVADAGERRREARDRVRDRVAEIGVARDEDVGAAVAVDIGDGDACVPRRGVRAGGQRNGRERPELRRQCRPPGTACRPR